MDPTRRRIRKIDRDAQRFVAQALGNTDLSLSDYDMIHTVRHRPGVTQEELRRLYCLDKSTIARRAAKLEEAGAAPARRTSGARSSLSPKRATPCGRPRWRRRRFTSAG